jgi:hypothetical protein
MLSLIKEKHADHIKIVFSLEGKNSKTPTMPHDPFQFIKGGNGCEITS